MSVTLGINEDYVIPTEIAKTVLDAASYTDDDVIYPAFKWLRENQPLGVAVVDGYDPIWLVTKYADIMAVERDANLFHNADSNPILNSQVNDQFMRSINHGSLRLISSLTFHGPSRSMDCTGRLPRTGFCRRISASWKARCGELAKQSVEKFLSYDGECDFIKDFALYYPLRVIMTLFGVPARGRAANVEVVTQEFFGTNDPEEQRDDIKLEPDAAAPDVECLAAGFLRLLQRAERRAEKKPDG